MLRRLFVILVTLLPQTAMSQNQTDDQIKALALEAILENPQVILDAMAILEQQRNDARAEAGAAALAAQRTALEDDPNAPVGGNPDGDAVVIEFFDYNCPYCKRSAGDLTALLDNDDDVRVVYREWPILGEGSVFAAKAALAARAQGAYSAMHEGLMGLRGQATEASVLALARDLGLDIDQLQADMQSDQVQAHIATSNDLARSLGFTGTPAFVIGDALIGGAVPLGDLQNYVAEARSDG